VGPAIKSWLKVCFRLGKLELIEKISQSLDQPIGPSSSPLCTCERDQTCRPEHLEEQWHPESSGGKTENRNTAKRGVGLTDLNHLSVN
jgi:hypothetical protein